MTNEIKWEMKSNQKWTEMKNKMQWEVKWKEK